MKFFVLLGGVIAVGTAMGLAVPTSHSAPTALAAGEELLGTASQTIQGQRDYVHAGMLAGVQASLRVAREKGLQGVDAVSITSDPPQSITIRMPLPGSGQMNVLMSLEDQGSTTRITQTISLSGDVRPDIRSKFEQAKSQGAFDKVGGGNLPAIG